MEHPNWLWNPLNLCEMGSSPFETGHSCCGITQNGDPCKNVIKKATLKSGRQKLDDLAERPISTANLEFQLRKIACDFLCTRWHRGRQSDSVAQKWYQSAMKNQPQTRGSPQDRYVRYPGLSNNGSRSRSSSLNAFDGPTSDSMAEVDSADDISSQWITPSSLLQGQIEWNVSVTRPAFLKIGNQNTGLRVLKLKSFTSQQNREQCYICHDKNEGSENVTQVALHCGRCELKAHLGCMQSWLGSLPSASPTLCPQW